MTITYTRQWNRDGTPISGATDTTYELVADDVGAVITVTVTATNEVGSASATSSGTAPVTDAPAGDITIDDVVQKSGEIYTFTARRSGGLSLARSATFTVSGATANPALAGDFSGGFPSGPVNFLAGAETATFTVTGNAAVQPE